MPSAWARGLFAEQILAHSFQDCHCQAQPGTSPHLLSHGWCSGFSITVSSAREGAVCLADTTGHLPSVHFLLS